MSTADWQQRMETTLGKHDVAIFGDVDRPGLSARVGSIEEKIRTEKGNRLWLIGILVAVAADILIKLIV